MTFKGALEKLLARKIDACTLPEAVGRMTKGKSITLLEAILLAQINKAICGDNTAASFLRDTSGNKLKDRANEESAQVLSFEKIDGYIADDIADDI